MEEQQGGDADEEEAKPEEESIAHGGHVHPLLGIVLLAWLPAGGRRGPSVVLRLVQAPPHRRHRPGGGGAGHVDLLGIGQQVLCLWIKGGVAAGGPAVHVGMHAPHKAVLFSGGARVVVQGVHAVRPVLFFVLVLILKPHTVTHTQHSRQVDGEYPLGPRWHRLLFHGVQV